MAEGSTKPKVPSIKCLDESWEPQPIHSLGTAQIRCSHKDSFQGSSDAGITSSLQALTIVHHYEDCIQFIHTFHPPWIILTVPLKNGPIHEGVVSTICQCPGITCALAASKNIWICQCPLSPLFIQDDAPQCHMGTAFPGSDQAWQTQSSTLHSSLATAIIGSVSQYKLSNCASTSLQKCKCGCINEKILFFFFCCHVVVHCPVEPLVLVESILSSCKIFPYHLFNDPDNYSP